MKSLMKQWIGLEFGLDRILILLFVVWSYFRSKRFFLNLMPFLVLWIFYDLSRGLADSIGTIHITEVYDLEKSLFGWMFGGFIPTEWAQHHQHRVLTVIFSLFYSMHLMAPFALGLILFYKCKDRRAFQEFTRSILLTSYLALLTFILYPVAPPWYVWNGGKGLLFDPPKALSNNLSAAGLINFDHLLGQHIFQSFYESMSINLYAAFPSLHAGYAFLVGYWATKKWGRNGQWVFLYPVGVCVGTVYLNHHYIIDLVAGIAYAFLSVKVINSIQKKQGIKS